MPDELNPSNAAESGGDPTGKTGSEPGGQGQGATDRGPAAKAGQDGGKGSGSAEGELTLEKAQAMIKKLEGERDHYQNKWQDREKNRKIGVVKTGKPEAKAEGDGQADGGEKPNASGAPVSAVEAEKISRRAAEDVAIENKTLDEVREYGKSTLGLSAAQVNETLDKVEAYLDDPANLDVTEQRQLLQDALAGRHQDVLIKKAHDTGYDTGYKAATRKLEKLLPSGGSGLEIPKPEEQNANLTSTQRALGASIERFKNRKKAG